jgi:glycosyltransferase involved in cell wall biosynthesis
LKQLLISIIVPVYNGEKYIAETLTSILSQDYTPIELIVVNDGSTDKSDEIIRSYKDVKYFCQENRGVPSARNFGIKQSNGEFIAFSDQDDLWNPGKLTDQVNYLVENPVCEYVVSKRKIYMEPGIQRPSWLKKELLDSEDVDYSPSSLLARASLFQKIGFFNADFENASDVDWFFKAKNAGIQKGIIDKVLYLKRVHEDNQSNRVQALHREYLQLIRQSIQSNKEV